MDFERLFGGPIGHDVQSSMDLYDIAGRSLVRSCVCIEQRNGLTTVLLAIRDVSAAA